MLLYNLFQLNVYLYFVYLHFQYLLILLYSSIAITNLNYFDQTEVLQGGEFKVIGMTSSIQTNSSGQELANTIIPLSVKL